MTKIILLAGLLLPYASMAQCPSSVNLTSTGNCGQATLTVQPANSPVKIVWNKDGSPVETTSVNTNPVIATVAGGNGTGSALNQLEGAQGVTVDAAGNVYVVEQGNARVTKWAPGATAGVTVAGGNGWGSASNQFYDPQGIFLDKYGNLYIVDCDNHRVQKWAPGATSGVTVAGGNGPGTAANQLYYPTDVFVDNNGNIYIADGSNYRIQKWAPGATAGITVAGGNWRGSAANQFNYPFGIFVDAGGNIYVTDYYNARVQKWAPGATSGVTVAGGNGPGSAANQLLAPTHIFVDAAGNIYVADFNNSRIQLWAPGAISGVTVAGGNGWGSAPNQLAAGVFMFVDNQNDIYVSDAFNDRVQRWTTVSDINTSYTATTPGTYTATVTDGAGCTFTSNPQIIDAPPVVTISSTTNNCVGAQLKTNTADNISQIVWYQDATTAVKTVNTLTQSTPVDNTYQTTTAGTYTAYITTPGGCTVTSNPVVVTPLVTPSIGIAASATAICAGTPVTFSAAPAGGGANPVYQWQVNNSFAGTNDIHFVAAGLTDGASVSCTMTSSVACPATPTATSNSVVLTVSPIVTPSVTITSSATTVCANAPVTYTASPVNGGPNPGFTWQVNGMAVTTTGPSFTSNSLQDGDKVSLLLSSDALCSTTPTALSNIIPVTVVKDPGSAVSITASSNAVCSGASVIFKATATNAGNTPAYQWQVNGTPSGSNSPSFTDSQPANGDIVTCNLTSDAVCPSAVSNSIALVVNPSPVVAPNQVFPISQGQYLTLQPVVSGDVSSYSWTPAYGLSDPAVADPVANPSATTDYTLKVTTAEGCEATGIITVKVYTELRIPNAFTPNGDGKNDVFYVMGGPAGSVIRDFSVFNRWGQKVFQVHGIAPGDPAYGWNGYYEGSAVSPGAYVYVIGMRFADGKTQTIQGTVMLIR